ncbi:MAG: hypothetical protein V7785_18605 [Bermanella sp.]
MRSIFIFISMVLLGACSNLPKADLSTVESKVPLYAKIVKENDKWIFKDVCQGYTSDVEFKSIKSCPEINHMVKQVSYVNLNTLIPMNDRRPKGPCNGSLWTGVKSCGVEGEFWETNLIKKSFALWLAIIPALVGNYWANDEFNWDAYNDAVEEALINSKDLDRKEIAEKANSELTDVNIRVALKFDSDRKAEKIASDKITNYKIKLAKQNRIERERAQKEKWARTSAENKRKREIALAEAKNRKENFRTMKNKKSIGSEVCSVKNRFGYMEGESGDKIKVLLKGVARGSYDDYFLFSSNHFTINTTKKDEIIWDNKNQWATCDLTGL